MANFLRSLLLRYLTLKQAQQEVKFVSARSMKAHRAKEYRLICTNNSKFRRIKTLLFENFEEVYSPNYKLLITKKIFLSNEVGISTYTCTELTCCQSTWNIYHTIANIQLEFNYSSPSPNLNQFLTVVYSNF